LIHGDKKTGVTIMRMDEGVDSGDILLQKRRRSRGGDLWRAPRPLANMGSRLLLKALAQLEAGTLQPHPRITAGPPRPSLARERLDPLGCRCPHHCRTHPGLSPAPRLHVARRQKIEDLFGNGRDSRRIGRTGTVAGRQPSASVSRRERYSCSGRCSSKARGGWPPAIFCAASGLRRAGSGLRRRRA